jgi:hypothetical protein
MIIPILNSSWKNLCCICSVFFNIMSSSPIHYWNPNTQYLNMWLYLEIDLLNRK